MQNNPNPFDPNQNPNPDPNSPTPPPASPYGAPSSPYGSPPPTDSPYGASTGTPYGSPGAVPPPMQPGNGRQGTVSLDVIGEAWKYLQSQIGVWIGAFLILIVINVVVGQLSSLIIMGASRGSREPSIPLVMLSTIPGWIVGTLLGAGLTKMAIQHIRTGRAELGEMFSVTNVFGALLIASILMTIATYVGLFLCIVPGIIIALGLSMTNSLIVDQGLDAMEAMKRSWNTMKSQLGMLFLLGIVLFLVNIGGACLCGLGLLVTGPLSIIALALVYRDMFGGNIAPPSASNYSAPPPIASPR